jgi:hypothetical protein
LALSASYRVAASVEAEAGKLTHDTDIPMIASLWSRFLPAQQRRGNPTTVTRHLFGERAFAFATDIARLASLIRANVICINSELARRASPQPFDIIRSGKPAVRARSSEPPIHQTRKPPRLSCVATAADRSDSAHAANNLIKKYVETVKRAYSLTVLVRASTGTSPLATVRFLPPFVLLSGSRPRRKAEMLSDGTSRWG